MAKVVAVITTSVDGYIAGPEDGPGQGLGEGGERLHYWVFGGPWTYGDEPQGEATGEDAEWLAEGVSKAGAVVGGRWTYEAAEHWGGESPWPVPFFIVTHRPDEEPEAKDSRSYRASKPQSSRPRRLPATRTSTSWAAPTSFARRSTPVVDELVLIVAPVVLGGGKRLFEGFTTSLDFEHLGVRQSPFATYIEYRVKPA